MQAILTAAQQWWPVVVPSLLALVFLGLWLRARGGGGSEELNKQLRAAQNEVRLLKGDAIQARREHANEVGKLQKELETLRAVAEGRVPPELEQWKQRALEAEQRLEKELERHRAEIEKVLAVVGEGGGSVDRTMVAPGGTRERIERMEQELAEAQQALAAATERYDGELAALTERLNAEKAAALTAQAQRHAAELDALRSRLPAGTAPPAPALAPAAETGTFDASVPDSARYPFLQAEIDGAPGPRFYLPYDMATLGRSDANTIVLQESMASRVHAEVRFDGVDFELADRNSTNGTLLNGELVSTSPLAFGDVVAIGQTRLTFSCEAAEATESDPAFAEQAFRAMLALAPNCRPALHGLGYLLEQGGRREELQAIVARLEQIEGPAQRVPAAAGQGDERAQ
jgi:hypothetical protein